jgi:hypothetical protein
MSVNSQHLSRITSAFVLNIISQAGRCTVMLADLQQMIGRWTRQLAVCYMVVEVSCLQHMGQDVTSAVGLQYSR